MSDKHDYDVIIRDGRVMDPETGFDQVCNVGVRDGRIVTITKDPLDGAAEVIDASGHVVAPGFIDTHHHWPHPVAYRLGLRDGRTTMLEMEMGVLGSYVDTWYTVREGKSLANFGASSSHEAARSAVLDGNHPQEIQDFATSRAASGWARTKASLEQGNQILQVMDEGLQAGAIGVGSTLGYMRDGVSAREAFEIQRLAAAYGRQAGFHFRYTPGTSTWEANGIQELLANAAALGAPALACHFNNPGYNLVHELLVRMRERGMNVWGEIYPYAAGSTTLNAVFLDKETWVDTLGHRYEDTLQDAVTGEFYTNESRQAMLRTEPARLVVLYKMPESAIVDWLALPGASIASDAVPIMGDFSPDTPFEDLPNSHPRLSGCYAKALRVGRENGIPLMQIIAQTSYNSALPLGKMGLKAMQERGRMQEGMVADITIFDPETVKDNATYAQGTIPSSGIPYVLVNGVIAVKDSTVQTDVTPGQPIRFESQPSGFEPILEEAWKHTYTVASADFGGTEGLGAHD